MIAVALIASSLTGCTATIPPADADLLTFLRAGETTRQEVLGKLGQPSASFEQGRVLTYRVGHDAKQGYHVVTANPRQLWEGVRYSVVLVFDAVSWLPEQDSNLQPSG
jgi:hypothetical protein